MAITKEEMATKIDVTDWFSLRAHLERGGIIVVDPLLDLAEVGTKVAADDVKSVERWVSSGLLGKPTLQQIGSWDEDQARSFLCLIVSPYVLVQEQTPQH